MKHVDESEATALPERLGRAFVAGAPCVAVVVADDEESHGSPGGETDEPVGHAGRARATVYRVGDGYVIEGEDASGNTETVGVRSEAVEAYVDRVRRDGAWTLLSIADEGTGARRERVEDESLAGR